ncbi:MAG: hypothetical protein ACLUSL_09895 [Ruminococcus sp.]
MHGRNSLPLHHVLRHVDLDGNEEQQMAFYNTLQQALAEGTETIDGFSYSVSCREEARSSFYSLFGGMLYLGALLSLVFLFGTVLIMYYKQISEGYEDAARFGDSAKRWA